MHEKRWIHRLRYGRLGTYLTTNRAMFIVHVRINVKIGRLKIKDDWNKLSSCTKSYNFYKWTFRNGTLDTIQSEQFFFYFCKANLSTIEWTSSEIVSQCMSCVLFSTIALLGFCIVSSIWVCVCVCVSVRVPVLNWIWWFHSGRPLHSN